MRRKIAVLGSLLVAAFAGRAVAQCSAVRPAPAGPAVYVEDQNLDAGATSATISVKLATGSGNQVAGTQNDLTFPAGVEIKAVNNKPDCTVNAAIDKTGTAFSFRPSGCTPGTNCMVRSLVLSLSNTDPIPDGSALYTCNVTVSGSGGSVAVSGVRLSTPAGTALSGSTSQDGNICAGGGEASPTPTQGTSSCAEPSPAPAGPAVWVAGQNVDAAGTVAVEVKLATGSGNQVAGTQNDLTFPAGAEINVVNNKPDCAVNPAIDKGGTAFSFRPSGCTPGTNCMVRALVLSLSNTDPIPDGSTLYTCNLNVTTGGTVNVTGVRLSTPAGTALSGSTGQDGIICLGGGTPPTPTPTAGTATCADPAGAPAGPAVWAVGKNVSGPGTVALDVKLATGSGNQVAGTQNDLTFPAGAEINVVNNKPDCAVNPAIDKGGTAFSFRPSGCTPGTNCMVRALVLSLSNTDPIPDGSTLYTCNLNVTTGGTVNVTGVRLSTPAGTALSGSTGQDAVICVAGVPTPTFTSPPVASSTPTPTLTVPPPSPTTPAPKNTATATATRAATASGTGVIEDEGGCQINTLGTSSSGWLLLFPVAAILVIRRRSR